MKLCALVLVCGCAQATAVEPPPAAAPVVAERPHTAPTQPSVFYEAPGPAARHDGLAARIERAVADAAAREKRPIPEPDARLDAAMRDLSTWLDDSGGMPDYALTEFALRRHGVVEQPPQLVAVTISGGGVDDDEFLRDLANRLPELLAHGRYNRLGIGIDEWNGRAHVVLALVESLVKLDRVPRVLAPRATFAVRGSIAAGYREPEVLVTAPSGEVAHPAQVRDGSGFRAMVTCAGVGPHQVEITAVDPMGPQVLANFPVYCGSSPPESPPGHVAEAAVRTPEQAEARVFELLNEDRKRAGLPPLAADAQVAAVARAHSADMRDHGFVGHNSPSSGGPTDRLRRAGLSAPVMLENVARAYSAEEIESGLMNSPGHRANILANDVTHVGVGIAFGSESSGKTEMFATQLFVRRVGPIDPASAAAAVLSEINSRRARKQLRPVVRDAQLEQAALEFSQAVKAGRARRGDGQTASSRAIELVGHRYGEVGTLFAVLPEVARLPEADPFVDPAMTHVGVGVAIGTSPDFGAGALFVTVVFGKPQGSR